MKKSKLLVSSLLASALLLAGCGQEQCEHVDEDKDHKCDLCGEVLSTCVDEEPKDHVCDYCGEVLSSHTDGNTDHKCDYCEADLPWVEEVEISGAPEQLGFTDSVTLSATVTAHNGAANTVNWSVDDSTLATISKIGVLTIKSKEGTVTVTATSTVDSSVKDTVQIAIFNNGFAKEFMYTAGYTFATEFPTTALKTFVGNGEYATPVVPATLSPKGFYYKTFEATAQYPGYFEVILDLSANQKVALANGNALMSNLDANDFLTYVNDPVNEISFFIDDAKKYEVEVYTVPGATSLYFSVCFTKTSDIFVGSSDATTKTSWTYSQKSYMKDVLGTELPFFKFGNSFTVSGNSEYFIVYDRSANFDLLSNAVQALTTYGFTYDSQTGMFILEPADKPYLYYTAFVGFIYGYGNFLQVEVYTRNFDAFPSQAVADFLDIAGYTLPEPTINGTTTFNYSVGKVYDDDAMAILVNSNTSLADYVAKFDDEKYTVTDDGEGDYTIEFVEGNRIVSLTVFEMYDDDFQPIAGSLYISIIVRDVELFPTDEFETWLDSYTTDTIPEITSPYATYYVIKTANKFTLEIEGFSADDYKALLTSANFTLKGSYYYSENGTLKLTIVEYYEDYFSVGVEKVITTWPAATVAKHLANVTGLDPIPAAIGSEFVDGTTSSAPSNCCKIKVYGTEENLTAYITLLTQNNYVLDDNDGNPCYVSENETVKIYIDDYTYDETTPMYTLEIYGTSKVEEESSFPTDAVTSALGGEYSYPIPTGTGFAASNPYVDSDVVIDITGGDRTAYITALLDAGFTYDEDNSYYGYSAYDDPTETFIIYVYDSDSNEDYTIEFGPYFGSMW